MTCIIGEGTPLNLMIDSGADVNVLTLSDWMALEENNGKFHDVNKQSDVNIRSYASTAIFEVTCTFKAWIKAEGKPETFTEFVEGGSKSLFGRKSATEMRLLAIGSEVNRITAESRLFQHPGALHAGGQ